MKIKYSFKAMSYKIALVLFFLQIIQLLPAASRMILVKNFTNTVYAEGEVNLGMPEYDNDADFYLAVESAGYRRSKAVGGKNLYANRTYYNDYNIIVYGDIYDVPTPPQQTQASTGYPLYIGYDLNGVEYKNPEWVVDQYPATAPDKWTYMTISGAQYYWDLLPLQKQWNYNGANANFHNDDYEAHYGADHVHNLKISSTTPQIGTNRVKLVTAASVISPGRLEVQRKGADGKAYWATFSLEPMVRGFNIAGSLLANNATMEAMQDTVTVPITCTADLTGDGLVAGYIKLLDSELDTISINGGASKTITGVKSSAANVININKVGGNITLSRTELKVGTNTITLSGKTAYESYFKDSGEKSIKG